MTTYHVDNQAETNGDGTPDHPWIAIAPNVNKMRSGDRMLVYGYQQGPLVYYEDMVDARVNGADGAEITVIAREGDQVEVRGKDVKEYHRPIFNLRGDYWNLVNLGLNGEWRRICGAVDVIGNHNTLLNCTVRDALNDWVVRLRGEHSLVDTCHIRDGRRGPGKDCAGVLVAGASHSRIARSNVHDMHGDCVLLLDTGGDVSDLAIVDNHLWTSDGTRSENAIDMKIGENIDILGNRMHGFRPNDGSVGSTGSPGDAVTVHMLAGSVTLAGNKIWDCPLGIRVQKGVARIHHNIIHDLVPDDDSWIAALLMSGGQAEVYHNTFARCPRALYVASPLSLINNLFWQTGQIEVEQGVQVSSNNNGWFQAQEMLPGSGNVVGDDPRMSDDFHLLSGSDCIDAGAILDEPYNGEAPDLGAYEYAGGPEPPVEGESVVIGDDYVLLHTGVTQNGVAVVRLEKVS